jgi:hypothetical protein
MKHIIETNREKARGDDTPEQTLNPCSTWNKISVKPPSQKTPKRSEPKKSPEPSSTPGILFIQPPFTIRAAGCVP